MIIGVLEDDDADYALIKSKLGKHEVSRFSTLEGFLKNADKFGFAIIDLSLPDSWGVETVKAVSGAVECPFIVLTSLGGDYLPDSVRDYIESSGAIGVFSKGDGIDLGNIGI